MLPRHDIEKGFSSKRNVKLGIHKKSYLHNVEVKQSFLK